MTSARRRNVEQLAVVMLGLLIGAILAAILLPALSPPAHADPIDPVVASDHALRTVATVAPADAPDPPPSVLDRALDIAGPVGRGALGGIACLAVAWLLARARERWGWLRRGWAGNAAAATCAALATFGGVLAVGGSVPLALTALGSAMAGSALLDRDPKTMRRVPSEPAPVESGEVPT